MPAVTHLQTRAGRSQRWWLSVRHRVDEPLPRLMLSYLTRTGSPDHRGVAATNPQLLSGAARLLPGADPEAQRPSEMIASSSLALAGRTIPTRLLLGAERVGLAAVEAAGVEAWTPAADSVVARAPAAVDRGAADGQVRGTGR